MGSFTSEVKRSVASHEDVKDPRFAGRMAGLPVLCELLCDENGVGNAELVEYLDE